MDFGLQGLRVQSFKAWDLGGSRVQGRKVLGALKRDP